LETKIYSHVYDLETVSLRYFNVYSECQTTEGPYATAVANWMESIRENKKPFITGDGEQRRDMIHVNDVISANIFAMEFTGKFNGQHYDIGTGNNISLNEIKEIIQKHHDINFDYIEARPGEVLLTKAKTKPLGDLGWKHSISIKQGITNCFKEIKK
jgi:nucleoside-diphosphate-sugar epimerase